MTRPVTKYDLLFWAITGWMECRGEPELGKVEMMETVWNRYLSGKWYGGETVRLVCLRDQQFSSWNAMKTDNNREAAAVLDWDADPAFRHFVDLAAGIADGSIKGRYAGATHYFDERLPEWPLWEKTATLLGQDGHHRFYGNVA